MKRFLFISTLILISGLILMWMVLQSQKATVCGTPEPNFICGNVYMNPNFNDSAIEGKYVFNTNCAACHKISRHMTGPALQSVIEAYDSINFIAFVKENKRITEKQLDYEYDCMTFPHLSEDDINNLLAYINSYHY